MSKLTLEDIKRNPKVKVYIEKANEQLGVIGYTEHGDRHASLVAHISRNILARLGFPERDVQLAAIAGYLHDIGNVINRENHAQTGGIIAYSILNEMKMPLEEIAEVIAAIGNHHEEDGDPVSKITAAVILADKSDVHRTRVRTTEMLKFDIHDRVNYAAKNSFLKVNEKSKTISLEITIDTNISQVMEYFEIFLSRMVASRRAAGVLDCNFELIINGIKLL